MKFSPNFKISTQPRTPLGRPVGDQGETLAAGARTPPHLLPPGAPRCEARPAGAAAGLPSPTPKLAGARRPFERRPRTFAGCGGAADGSWPRRALRAGGWGSCSRRGAAAGSGGRVRRRSRVRSFWIRRLIAVGQRRMVAFVADQVGSSLIRRLDGSTPEVLSLMVLPSLEFSGLGCCQIQSRWRLVGQEEDRRKLWSASSARHRRRL